MDLELVRDLIRPLMEGRNLKKKKKKEKEEQREIQRGKRERGKEGEGEREEKLLLYFTLLFKT